MTMDSSGGCYCPLSMTASEGACVAAATSTIPDVYGGGDTGAVATSIPNVYGGATSTVDAEATSPAVLAVAAAATTSPAEASSTGITLVAGNSAVGLATPIALLAFVAGFSVFFV